MPSKNNSTTKKKVTYAEPLTTVCTFGDGPIVTEYILCDCQICNCGKLIPDGDGKCDPCRRNCKTVLFSIAKQ